MRTFFTIPSPARTQVVLGAHFVPAILIGVVVVSGTLTPLVVWAAFVSLVLSLATGRFMLDVDSSGAVTNRVSVLAGRPIALTGRAREQITLDRVAAERRPRIPTAFLAGLVAIVLSGVIVVVVAVLVQR